MINLGKMTPEEVADLLEDCINTVTEEQLFNVLNSCLTKNQKEELALSWAPD